MKIMYKATQVTTTVWGEMESKVSKSAKLGSGEIGRWMMIMGDPKAMIEVIPYWLYSTQQHKKYERSQTQNTPQAEG